MKKKLVALLAAAMMVLSTTTVLAAPSATTDKVEMGTVAELKANVKGAESAAGKVTVAEVTDTKAVESVDEAALAIVQKETADVKAKVLGMADISLPEGTDLSAGVQIKVTVDGVYSTDTVNTIKALHWNGAKWEDVKVVKVEKGNVTIEVTDLSPIAFVKVIPTADKFGVEFAVLPLVAVAGLAGAVVTGKKANK